MTATYTWDELLGGESAILIRLGQLLFVWKKDDTTIKVIPSGPAEAEAEPDENPTLDVIFEIDVPPKLLGRHDAEGFESFCREFVGMAATDAETILPAEAKALRDMMRGRPNAYALAPLEAKLERIAAKSVAIPPTGVGGSD